MNVNGLKGQPIHHRGKFRWPSQSNPILLLNPKRKRSLNHNLETFWQHQEEQEQNHVLNQIHHGRLQQHSRLQQPEQL